MNMVLRIYNKKTREAFIPPSPEPRGDDCNFRMVSTDKYILYLRRSTDERVTEKHWERQVANRP